MGPNGAGAAGEGPPDVLCSGVFARAWSPLVLAVLCWGQPAALRAEPDPLRAARTATAAEASAEPAGEVDGLGIALASAGLTALVLGVGTEAWWSDGLQPFSFRETGFLGHATYAGGADKLGHMWCSYVSVAMVTAIYRALGLPPTRAAWYAALFTGLLFNGFELIDGFTRFGFEYGDVIANTLGMSFGLVTHLVPGADDLVGLRLAYTPSEDFLRNEKSYLKVVNDYSGMNYYLDLKYRGLARLAGADPGVGRYFLGGLVFGTYRYSPVKVWEERSRYLGVHVGLDLAELLRARSDGDPAMLKVARVFDFLAFPFLSVALMKNLDGEDWFLNFGVAHRHQLPL